MARLEGRVAVARIDLEAQQRENGQRFIARHRNDAGLLARFACEQKQFAHAVRLAHASLKDFPADLDALLSATRALAGLQQSAPARRLLERYLAACPGDPIALALQRELEGLSQCRSTMPQELLREVPERTDAVSASC